MASDLPHGIDGLLLGFVISARQDLRYKPQAKELNACENEYGRRKQQRPVLKHDVLVEQQLLQDQERPHERAGSGSEQPEEAEEMQWPSGIVEQKRRAQEVEEDPKDPRESIIGLPVLARGILDRN